MRFKVKSQGLGSLGLGFDGGVRGGEGGGQELRQEVAKCAAKSISIGTVRLYMKTAITATNGQGGQLLMLLAAALRGAELLLVCY
jgi:hypothetical protein